MNGAGTDLTPAELAGTPLCGGTATGPVLVLDEPVSFWGGVGPDGRVIDVHHPQHGRLLTGSVLAMPSGRGSSSSAAVLAEQIRAGTAPAAIVLAEADGILVAGALVAGELYDLHVPVLTLPREQYERLAALAAASAQPTARVVADDRSATVTLQGAR